MSIEAGYHGEEPDNGETDVRDVEHLNTSAIFAVVIVVEGE
jgi:hypothetical protein